MLSLRYIYRHNLKPTAMNSMILSTLSACAIAFSHFGCTADNAMQRNGYSAQRVTPSKTIIKKNYNTGNFTGIDVAQGIIVHYTQKSGKPSATVKGPDNIVSLLDIGVVDSTIEIRYKDNVSISYSSGDESRYVHVYLTSPSLKELDASSGARISVTGSIDVKCHFSIDVSSGAEVNLATLKTREADCNASSGASIVISSLKAEEVDLRSSSGANIKVSTLNSGALTARASSGADIKLASGSSGYADYKASSSATISAGGLSAKRGSANASSSGTIISSIRNAEVRTSSSGSVRNR